MSAPPYATEFGEHCSNLYFKQLEQFKHKCLISNESFDRTKLSKLLEQYRPKDKRKLPPVIRKLRERLDHLDVCGEVFTILENQDWYPMLVAAQQLDSIHLGCLYRDMEFLPFYDQSIGRLLFHEECVNSLPETIKDGLLTMNIRSPKLIFVSETSICMDMYCIDIENRFWLMTRSTDYSTGDWNLIVDCYMDGDIHQCAEYIKTAIRTSNSVLLAQPDSITIASFVI